MPFETPQGLVFKFNNKPFTVTSLSVTKGAGEFNVTSLNVAPGDKCISVFRPGALKSVEIKADFIGNTLPPQDKTYALHIDGVGAATGGKLWGEGESESYMAACTSVQITAQAGELIKGSATFKLSYD